MNKVPVLSIGVITLLIVLFPSNLTGIDQGVTNVPSEYFLQVDTYNVHPSSVVNAPSCQSFVPYPSMVFGASSKVGSSEFGNCLNT